MSNKYLKLITNYIYIYHLTKEDEYWILPTYPDSIADKMESTFSQQNALSRSAPVFSFSNSGPRSVQITLELHREMLDNVNIDNPSVSLDIGEDYIDKLINRLQSIALPRYVAATRSVIPPHVAVCFGKDIFIKGVVTGGVSVTYEKPIIEGDRYAKASISFNVFETDPYDAESVSQIGSFRSLTSTMKNNNFVGEGLNAPKKDLTVIKSERW